MENYDEASGWIRLPEDRRVGKRKLKTGKMQL